MSERRRTARLILAPQDRSELILADDGGAELRRIPAAGYPRFPAWRPGGGVAYVAITSVAEPWQVIVAVLDPDWNLLDVVPGAAVFGRPTWSPDGSRLLLLRGDSARAEAIEWSYEDGGSRGMGMRDGLRSAAWGSRGELIVSVGGSVVRDDDTLMTVPAARGLAEFGSDDLYATIDQLTVGPRGEMAAVERWYRQGLAPKEQVIVMEAGGAVVTRRAGRAPWWLPNGDLLLTSDEGVPQRHGHTTAIQWAGEPIHSACWIGEPD